MSTTIRPEISKKNPYWIDRHRYYELKHFCLQYPMWKKAYISLDSFVHRSIDVPTSSKTNDISNPVVSCVESGIFYSERIDMIERVAKESSKEFGDYILKAVTEGYSYDYLKTVMNIPCCKEIYYECYRRFFWLLNRARK